MKEKTDAEVLAEQPVPELDSDRIKERKSKEIIEQKQAEKDAKKSACAHRRHKALMTFFTLIIGAAIGITAVYTATVLCAKKTFEEAKPSETSAAVVHPNADLALKFLQNQPELKNSILSPLSIEYTLAMLRDGAPEGSETRQQIEALIGDRDLPQYENVKKHISFANALWIKEDFKNDINSDFVSHLADAFNAEVKYDRFSSTKNINKWVSERTFGMIKQVFDKLDDGAKIILANTLAIDAHWQDRFGEILTTGHAFYLHDDDRDDQASYEATTMQGRCSADIKETTCKDIKYAFQKDSTIFTKSLEKYGNSELEFVVVMPNDLNDYVSKLTTEQLNSDTAAASEIKVDNDQYDIDVDYYLPRFNYEGGIKNFTSQLKNFGVTNIFSPDKAELTNMYKNDHNKLCVSDAIHKTVIGVDEKGIRAAAITAVEGGLGSGGWEPYSHIDLTIAINRPFLYLVRDKNTKDIWFIGTVYKPNDWKNDASAYGEDYDDEDDYDYEDDEDLDNEDFNDEGDDINNEDKE